jgi:hypothetical protein
VIGVVAVAGIPTAPAAAAAAAFVVRKRHQSTRRWPALGDVCAGFNHRGRAVRQ